MNAKFFPVLVAGSAIVAIFWTVGLAWMQYHDDGTRQGPSVITIDTAHIATVSPHEHSSGDAVSDPGHHEEVVSTDFVVDEDFAVTDVAFEILHAPAAIVHHAALVSYSCADTACTNRVSRELFRYGQDTMHYAKGSFPSGYMVPLHKGEHLKLSLAVHNPAPPLGSGDTYHEVYGRIVLQENAVRAKGAKPVRFVHLYVEDLCSRNADDDVGTFTIPAHVRGYVYTGCGPQKNASITFASSGTIVHMGGHLHGWQGGKDLIVEKNGTLFRTFSTTASPDDHFRFDTTFTQVPVHVSAGDTLSLRAVYDNSFNTPIRGVMGMLGFYIADE